MFLSSLIKNVDVERRSKTAIKNRSTSRHLYLVNGDGEKKRVCLKFFCSTFSISHRVVELTMRNIGLGSTYVGHDRRLGKCPVNKTTDENRDLVLEHINSFPTVEAHYCRKNSKKLYLSSDLNLSIMYRLYKEFCVEKDKAHVSEYVYRKLFNELSPQRSFFVPKKDQCFLCNAYQSKKIEERTVPIQEEWEQYKRREKEALDSKAKDKQYSKDDGG